MALEIDIDAEIADGIGPKVEQGVKEYLMDGADKGHAVAVDRAPVDRGTLLQALSSFPPTWVDGSVRYGVQDVPHARPMEFGTAPYYPPLEPLLEWSERVSGGKGLGFYVARVKIPSEGIDAQPYMRPGRDAQESWYGSHGVGEYLDEQF
jgi:hypothetical protein